MYSLIFRLGVDFRNAGWVNSFPRKILKRKDVVFFFCRSRPVAHFLSQPQSTKNQMQIFGHD